MLIKLKDDPDLIGATSINFYGYRVTIGGFSDISDAPDGVKAKAAGNPTLIVELTDDAPVDVEPAVEPEGGDEKANVVAELKALGVDFDGRLGVEKLRGLLAEALEKDAA